VPPLSAQAAGSLLKELSGWNLTPDKKAIFKELKMKDFLAAIDLMHKIAEVAEREDHHPDLHLTGYRTCALNSPHIPSAACRETTSSWLRRSDELPKALKL